MTTHATIRSRILFAPLLLAAFAVQADTPACLISFDAARLNVCEDRASLANENLRHLADVQAFAGSSIRVVKFGGPITARQRLSLETQGAEILGYVPYYGYKVRMAPSMDRRVRTIPGVVWTGPYLPAWKIGINLSNELLDGRILNAGGDELDSLEVTLHRGVAAEQARVALAAIPGTSHRVSGRGHDHDFLILSFDRARLGAAVQALAAHPDVDAVNFHWPAHYMNSQAGSLHQGGLGDPDHRPIFDQGIFGCGQFGAMLDSGLHIPNCAFNDTAYGDPVWDSCSGGAGCPAITPDFDHRKIGAHYKWSGTAGGPADDHGHGTHVAGSFIGNNPAGAVDCENFTTPGGLGDLDGTAPGAQFISQEAGGSLQYLNDLGGTLYHAATVAYDNGARIHNNSWGSSCRLQGLVCIPGCQVEYRTHSRGGDAAVWENPDLLIFVAAGNSGGGDGSAGCGPGADVGAPGNAKNIFSIGSTQRGAAGDSMSGFSSRGPTQDRRTKPDFTAQGSGIQSAERNACGTRTSSGTSMASPTAAGLGTLVREYLQRGFYPLGVEDAVNAIASPSAALIKAIMINGAEHMTGDGTGGDAPNQNQGWGRVLLDNALFFEGDARNLWLHDEQAGLETGGQDVHMVTVAAGQPLIATLVWHDFPAEVNAEPHIVNMLRLEVETPDGDVWTQKLESEAPLPILDNPDPFQDTTDTDFDNRNTVHQITLVAPIAGDYLIRVTGIQVAMGGTQPYALAVTGDLQDVSAPDFLLRATPAAVAACRNEDAEIEIGLRSLSGFDEAVTLSSQDLPAGVSSDFSVNPVIPADPAAVSVLTLGNLDSAAGGDHTFIVEGSSVSRTRQVTIALSLFEAAPGAPGITAPDNDAVDVSVTPAVEWTAADDAFEYQLEIATDAGFGTVVYAASSSGTSHTVSSPLASQTGYHLRVRAVNGCGGSQWSEAVFFVTELVPGDCPAGTIPEGLFYENFSGGGIPPGWSTLGSVGPVTWEATDAQSADGDFSLFARNIDFISDQHLTTPAISLPDDAEEVLLTFQNWQSIESKDDGGGCWDGGILEASTDMGLTWEQVEDQILHRPYDGEIGDLPGWGNPLTGRPGWCGDPRPWERYAVDLSEWAGEEVRFRFRLGTDSLVDRVGWFLDAVEVKSCSVPDQPGPGILAVDPDTLDFGEVEAGGSETLIFEVSNEAEAGSESIELDGVSITDGAGEFEITGGSCETGSVLVPQEICTVEVTFGPDVPGGYTGTALVETAGGSSATVALEGTGTEDQEPPGNSVFKDRFEQEAGVK